MRPASGVSAPEIRLSTVVLPEPFGPIRPTISPALDAEADIVDRLEAAEDFASPSTASRLRLWMLRSDHRGWSCRRRPVRLDQADDATRQDIDDDDEDERRAGC